MTQSHLSAPCEHAQKTKGNIFMDADRMLHHVASTDYKDTELYHTKNMREWFYKDWYFRDGILVGKVDRENERVLIKLPYKEYVGGQTAMYYCTRSLTEAFRHYTPITLTAFDVDEAEMLFKKALLDVMNRKTYKRMKYFLVATNTYEYLGGNTGDYVKELLEECSQKVSAIDEENRRKLEEDERKRQEHSEKCYEFTLKYFKKAVNINSSMTKILKAAVTKGEWYYGCHMRFDITKKEWEEAHELEYSKYYNSMFYINNHYDENCKRVCPDDPFIEITATFLNTFLCKRFGLDYSGKNYYDFLFINDNGDFVTTRGVLVQDQRGLVKKLLKKFVACKTDKAREKFIGLHVGSFEIREWDTEGQFLQVGCHRFPLKALEQLASEL